MFDLLYVKRNLMSSLKIFKWLKKILMNILRNQEMSGKSQDWEEV